MKAVVIHNPKSGTSLDPSELKKIFTSAGLDIEQIIDIAEIEKSLRKYIGKKDIVVAAYGGDGTLNSVAKILVGTDTLFAPLPGGTLNHFTKDAGISQDIETAIKNIVGKKPRRVDVAKVNDEIFLNNSSLGIYPSTLRTRKEMENKLLGKWSTAIVANFKALVRYRIFDVNIEGETIKTPFVFVGNNDYVLENLLGEGRTSIDKGILSVYVLNGNSRRSLLYVCILSFIGRGRDAEELKIWKTDTVTIRTSKKHTAVSLDGERTVLTPPLKYEIIKSGLKIVG